MLLADPKGSDRKEDLKRGKEEKCTISSVEIHVSNALFNKRRKNATACVLVPSQPEVHSLKPRTDSLGDLRQAQLNTENSGLQF